MTPDELDAALRRIGAERYHNLHPFHQLLHGGKLTKGQVQAWALNRYCYQSAIPRKDASFIARTDDPELRRMWRQRLVDHDGDAAGEGGIARWLALTRGAGFYHVYLLARRGALAAAKIPVHAFRHFFRQQILRAAVPTSLTPLFLPPINKQRVS